MSRRHGDRHGRDYEESRSDGYRDPYAASQQAGPNYRWWIPADGILREVIQADIQRYLGPEAHVRPGAGLGENANVNGYWIAAYRTLTASMIQDLKADSTNWYRDPERASRTGRYEDSMVHRSRQHWGPTESASVPTSATTATEPDPRYGGADPYGRSEREDYRSPPAAVRYVTQAPAVDQYGRTQAATADPYGRTQAATADPYGRTQAATADPYGRTANPPVDAYGRTANPVASSPSSDSPYYTTAQAAGTAGYSSNAYGIEYDPRVPRSSATDPRAPTARTSDPRVARTDTSGSYPSGYGGSSYGTTGGQPSATPQARPGYYVASDGREYPVSQMPTSGRR